MDELPPDIHNRLMRMMGLTDPAEDAARSEQKIGATLDLLAALGVTRVVYRLDGGGDEGDTSLEEVVYADGRQEDRLPEAPTGFSAGGRVRTLSEELEEHAADAPDIDWVNNEGGSGTVTYSPCAAIGERIEVDVHSNPDDDDEGEDYEVEEDGE